MAEVLVGTEWIAVEESARAVQDGLAAELRDRREAIGEPMAATIVLTIPADALSGATGDRAAAGRHGRRRMTVAVSAINAIRERIESDPE